MTEQITARRIRKRRFWFMPRYGLRAFLLFSVMIGCVLGVWVKRTRHQMRVCDRLWKWQIASYDLATPPAWLRFLPKSWLSAYGGHWCCKVEKFSFHYKLEISTDRTRAFAKQHMKWISSLGGVEVLALGFSDLHGSTKELVEIFAPLQRLQGIRYVDSRCNVPNAILESLPPLKHLKELSLRDTKPNFSPLRSNAKVEAPDVPMSLSELAKFPELEKLSLWGTTAKDGDFSSLATLAHLKNVDATSLVTSGSEIKPLMNHPSLEDFSCNGRAYDDEILKVLASCPKLKSIHAFTCFITDTGMSYLSNAKNLEGLSLSRVAISDAGFACLTNCKSLQSISCTNCKLTDAIGPVLSGLPQLRNLDLRNTLTTSKLLESLKSNKDIIDIYVGNERASIDDLVAFFKGRVSPSTFGMGAFRPQWMGWRPPLSESWRDSLCEFCNLYNSTDYATDIDLSGIQGISGNLSRLYHPGKIISLALENSDINDKDLNQLASQFNLSILNIAGTTCTASALKSLKSQTSLKELTIGPIDDPELALQVISTLPALEELVFRGPQVLSNVAKSAILKMHKLTKVEFPDRYLDEQFAKELCQLPQLDRITSQNFDWSGQHIELYRIAAARESLGAPKGIRSRLVANPQTSFFDIKSEAELVALSGRPVYRLSVAGVPPTSSAIHRIAQFSDLHTLDLSGTGITDDKLSALRPLEQMSSLNLDNNPISDSAVDTLLSFPRIHHLSLANTRLSDKGISRLLQSESIPVLDLSGTMITAHAWEGLQKCGVDTLVLHNVSALRGILQNVPIHLLPRNLDIHDDGDNYDNSPVLSDYLTDQSAWIEFRDVATTLDRLDVECLRKSSPNKQKEETIFTPETLDIWPPSDLLSGEKRNLRIYISDTAHAAEICRLADRHSISYLYIKGEQLNRLNSMYFPKTARIIRFTKCTIGNQTIAAMANCPWLGHIQIDQCDLGDCSLEPLKKIPQLLELTIEGTDLSQSQKQTLNELRPTLVDAVGW